MQAAEKWVKDHGCKTMRLELLTSKTWKNPSKEFLKIWYSKIGYKPEFTELFEKMYPERVHDFATE
ncbi:MAG: hypothetical protein R2877_07740 [Bdellovibrionota bacterium]